MLAARLAAADAHRALLVTFSASSCYAPCRRARDIVDAFLQADAVDVDRLDVDIDRYAQDPGVTAVPTVQWFAPDRPLVSPPTHVGVAGLHAWLQAQASTSSSTSAAPTTTHTMPR